jgi:hypothetical protein
MGSEVSDDESLARYVFSKSHVRQDRTIRRAAFIPNPHDELSVTRRKGLEPDEVMRKGMSVAAERGKTLQGCANVTAKVVSTQGLNTIPAPVDANPNHANIVGWPENYDERKPLAEALAVASGQLEEPRK